MSYWVEVGGVFWVRQRGRRKRRMEWVHGKWQMWETVKSQRKEAIRERERGQRLLVFKSSRSCFATLLDKGPTQSRLSDLPTIGLEKVSVLTQRDYFPFPHYPSSREVFCVLSIHRDQISNLRNLREEKKKPRLKVWATDTRWRVEAVTGGAKHSEGSSAKIPATLDPRGKMRFGKTKICKAQAKPRHWSISLSFTQEWVNQGFAIRGKLGWGGAIFVEKFWI